MAKADAMPVHGYVSPSKPSFNIGGQCCMNIPRWSPPLYLGSSTSRRCFLRLEERRIYTEASRVKWCKDQLGILTRRIFVDFFLIFSPILLTNRGHPIYYPGSLLSSINKSWNFGLSSLTRFGYVLSSRPEFLISNPSNTNDSSQQVTQAAWPTTRLP